MKSLPIVIAALLLVLPANASAQHKLHWYRGNTHTHTANSDGHTSPDAVARWYKEHGYQFLFLTDHEFITDPAPLNAVIGASERFLILPGQEVTQWSMDIKHMAAHVNGLFTRDVIWPAGTRKCVGGGCGAYADAPIPLGETIDANIAAVRAQGGIAQVNHPNYRWSVRPEDLLNIPDGTLIEVWNGIDSINNLGGDDGEGDVRPSAEGYWDLLLSSGKLVWGVGADDSHDEKGRGQAWIVVRAAELRPAAIKAAIAKGNFYASTGVKLTDLSVDEASISIRIEPNLNGARYTTRFIGQDGKLLAEVGGTKPSYSFSGGETYVRASIIDSNGKHAWTQPVFRDARAKKVAEL